MANHITAIFLFVKTKKIQKFRYFYNVLILRKKMSQATAWDGEINPL